LLHICLPSITLFGLNQGGSFQAFTSLKVNLLIFLSQTLETAGCGKEEKVLELSKSAKMLKEVFAMKTSDGFITEG
jgi:hypothetical protein